MQRRRVTTPPKVTLLLLAAGFAALAVGAQAFGIVHVLVEVLSGRAGAGALVELPLLAGLLAIASVALRVLVERWVELQPPDPPARRS